MSFSRQAVLAATALACATSCRGPRGPSSSPRAPFVVAIVVDQLSAWVADERVPLLPEDGALQKLAREGTWVHAMRYPYAQTDTGPGHAALHTGKVPAETGLIVNELPVLGSAKRTSFLRDDAAKLVTPDGVQEEPGSSSARLLAPTVADRLREARPDAVVVAISLKDRGALLPAGKKPTHAIWFDVPKGSFVTSTAVASVFPAWAAPLGSVTAVERRRAVPWEPADARWLAEHAGRDDAPGEGDLDGLGTTFPHHAKTPKAFRATPAADALVLDLALAAVVAEHDPKRPFLLLLSMSTSDVVGHVFGPSSWEAWDQLRKLDAALARFLSALEAKVGPVSVVLTADHGNVPMPEARVPFPEACRRDPNAKGRYDLPLCVRGARLMPHELRDEIAAAADAALGRGDWVDGVADGYVFLSAAAHALDEKERALVDAAVRRVLLEKHADEVAEVYDVRDLSVRCPNAREGEDVLTLVCRSWRPDAGGGDYYVVPAYGSFFDGEAVPGKGSSHGTPYLYDRTVPMFVRATGAGAGVSFERPVDFTAFSAVLSSLVGLDPRSPREILDEHVLP